MTDDQNMRLTLLERDHDDLKQAVLSLRDSQAEISKSLQKLVVLEERHEETREAIGRAFKSLEGITERMMVIEREMPALKEMRGLVLRAVVFIMSAIGAAGMGMILVPH